ncbi:MAG: malonyl-CoA decarboxylase domain-containing protein [Microthrixaceae bacterium]
MQEDHPTISTTEPLGQLVDRRAALLAEDAPSTGELGRLTERIEGALGGATPVVRRVTLEDDPALLDRLVEREPVVPFRTGDARRADLANRLAEDRRCFALEHPALPGRPMNVVWVALCQGRPTALAPLLDPDAPTDDPRLADTAAFYSIWNAEPGLVGIRGGRSLLKGVMAALRDELPNLTELLTLSPVPGFRRWLDARGRTDGLDTEDASQVLALCARYLTSLDERGRPVDPVARFHLGNGARLLHLNWRADLSERGLARAMGVMANYRYEPEDRAANRAASAAGDPAVGPAVRDLLHPPAS